MDMVDRIRALCAAHGTNLFQLEKTLGFANGSLAKSDEKIQSWRLKAIADYFHVTVDYLISGETPEYYTNPETASLAQELFEDKDMRLLFDAAKGCPPDQLRLAAQMLKMFKATNSE